MFRPQNFAQEIEILLEDRPRVIYHAQKAQIGGFSNIYENQVEREAELSKDQLLGLKGHLALWMFLHPLGREFFFEARRAQDLQPRVSLGADISAGCLQIESKCSILKNTRSLILRDHERHSGWIYVQSFIPDEDPWQAHLYGWCYEEEVEERGGRAREWATKNDPLGPWRRPVKTLRPLSDLQPLYDIAVTGIS